MKVKLTRGRPASQEQIVALERQLGEALHPDYLDFLSHDDGAKPESNIFDVGTTNHSGVNGFIPVQEIVSEMARIENLPLRSFPVAWAEGGNYVFINQEERGAVFFWDHELPEQPIRLAD